MLAPPPAPSEKSSTTPNSFHAEAQDGKNAAPWRIPWREIGTVEESAPHTWKEKRSVEDSMPHTWKEIGTVEESAPHTWREIGAVEESAPHTWKGKGSVEDSQTPADTLLLCELGTVQSHLLRIRKILHKPQFDEEQAVVHFPAFLARRHALPPNSLHEIEPLQGVGRNARRHALPPNSCINASSRTSLLFLQPAVHFPRIPASMRTRARNQAKCTTACSKTAEVHAEKRVRRAI